MTNRLQIYRPGEEPEPSLLEELAQLYIARLHPGVRTQIQEHAVTLSRVAVADFLRFVAEHVAAHPLKSVDNGPTWRDGAVRVLVETEDGRLLRLIAPVDRPPDQPKPA